MRFLRQSLVGLFLAALTLGLLAYAGQLISGAVQERMSDDRAAPPARERVFAVSVTRAVPGRETPVLQTFGEVQSRRTLELRSAVGGRIVELAPEFTEGGVVRAGQLLVRIDPAKPQAALDRAVSDLRDAEAEVRDADRSLILARDEVTAAQEQAMLRDRAFARQRDLGERGVGTLAASKWPNWRPLRRVRRFCRAGSRWRRPKRASIRRPRGWRGRRSPWPRPNWNWPRPRSSPHSTAR